MEEKILQIQSQYLDRIHAASSLEELDKLFLELFGKSGVITLLPKEFASLPKEELQRIGPVFNQTKEELEKAVSDKRQAVREEEYKKLELETWDLEGARRTEDGERKKSPTSHLPPPGQKGHLHPLTQFENEIVDLFSKLGFQLFDAPHIDTDHYNFEVLNIPQEHPARDLWDTLYIDKTNIKIEDTLLLRTHTSNAQVRIMEQFKPPIRMMVLDRCFRYENLDARHEHTFDQFELVCVDKGLSMANLQYLSEYFLKSVLGEDIKVRMRPKYYPFVEPGVGIDGECMFCRGKGCKVCGGLGWLELGGAGMIHPTVLKNGGIDPKVYTGIAWGPGLERILLLKHAINDVRLFRNGDLSFLEKF